MGADFADAGHFLELGNLPELPADAAHFAQGVLPLFEGMIVLGIEALGSIRLSSSPGSCCR